MWTEQLLILWPLVLTLLVVLVFALYVFYSTPRGYYLKLLLGPALLGAAIFSFAFMGHRLGYAFPSPLPLSFEYLSHKVITDGTQSVWIDVTVLSVNPREREPRLHRVPWSKKQEESFEKANEMKKDRRGGSIEMSPGNGSESDDPDRGIYVPHRVLPHERYPKDPLPNDRVDRVPSLPTDEHQLKT